MFPILSRSTSLSSAPSSSLTAPASGQGEVIASGRAQSSSRMLRFDVAEGCCDKVLEESSSRHAELNLTDCAKAKIDRCFEGFANV